MRVALAIVLFVFANSLGAMHAAATSLDDALRPLNDGVPEIAVERLRSWLAQNPSSSEVATAKARLAEALVTDSRPEEALEALGNTSLTRDFVALFWRAQARAALEQWPQARADYEQVARNAIDRSLREKAAVGEVQALRALGQNDEALRILDSLHDSARWKVWASLGAAGLLIDRGDFTAGDRLLREVKPERRADRNERRFLFGRIQFAQRNYERAIKIWSPIISKPEGVPHSLLVATLLGIGDAYAEEGSPERGDDGIEDFIDLHPSDAALPILFAKLDALYQKEKKASPNELARWTRDRAQPRRAFAQWYLARSQLRGGDREAAIANLTYLERDPPAAPSLGEAYLELAHLLLADRQWDAALRATEAARRQNPATAFRARTDWLSAEANYQAGRLAKAAPIFEELAHSSPALAKDGFFNAALCWLRLEQPEKFSSDYRLISNEPAAQGELLLEEGAAEAAQGKADAATQSFQNFIRNFPQSPRVGEAWVALAEIAFHARKPDLNDVRQDLARARQGQSTPAAIERADYLEIWLEDAAPSSAETPVIAAATTFLQRHPGSAFTEEVRMKLAEAYFRRQDFANAQTQFELLAQQHPAGPLAEKALFFAARSALSSMGPEALDRALALFDQVGKLNGELKWAARNEQAAIERRLGKNRDALAIYDEVLKNEAKAPDRREALCGKGDVFYEMGASDPQNYRRAIELYEQLTNEPGVPPHWRNQAQFKKAKALEQLNDRSGALATYYSVIDDEGRPDREREMFWFYKAGFNAAHLLEDASDWKSAVAVYRKLAAVGGTRSEEARARLKQLRLEHFLWEE